MNIILNNRSEELEQSSLTVEQLLSLKNFSFKMLIVKINGRLIKKEDYPVAKIQDGDKVMVLHLISGG